MSLPTRRSFIATALALAAGATARAQVASPNQLVTLIVPFPAGGSGDATMRNLQPLLQRALNQTVIVENVAGASGTIGVGKLLAAPADGSTLIFSGPSEAILAPLAMHGVKYKSEDLRIVAGIGATRLVLVTRGNLGAMTFGELVERLRDKSKPPLSYGSFGVGSFAHLAMEDMKLQLSVDAVHVPYKGAGTFITDIAGGHVDFGVLPLIGNVVDLIKSGKLRALLVTDTSRSPQLPDVPSLAEVKALTNFDYVINGYIMAPKATPVAVVKRLSVAINTCLADPGFRQFMEGTGAFPAPPNEPAEAERWYKADIDRYRRLAKAIKLEPS